MNELLWIILNIIPIVIGVSMALLFTWEIAFYLIIWFEKHQEYDRQWGKRFRYEASFDYASVNGDSKKIYFILVSFFDEKDPDKIRLYYKKTPPITSFFIEKTWSLKVN